MKIKQCRKKINKNLFSDMMNKGNIIIIEATSTGANYIHDARELGYNPICMELHHDEEDAIYKFVHDLSYSLNDEEPPEIILADESYEKTLEMVKKLNPVCIIPGGDEGIVWATKMAHELGLPGNDPKNLKKMLDKKHMHYTLRDAGLRYIRSKEAHPLEEAKQFIKELDSSKFVVKPSIGRSTVGVCICENEDELKDALELNSQIYEPLGGETIIQEYIGGEEYSLDTVCCKGHNRVVSAYYYKKILIDGKGPVYDYALSLSESDPVYREMEEYNFKVMDAIGIQYGVVHSEYKYDENGPVLMEVNCRPLGLYQRYDFHDITFGQHQTRISLESYLNPEKTIANQNKAFKLLSHSAIKIMIQYEDIDVVKSKIEEVFTDLESYCYALYAGNDRIYPKTVDLATSGGMVYLTNKNKDKLMEDIKKINRVEQFEVEKLFEIRNK